MEGKIKSVLLSMDSEVSDPNYMGINHIIQDYKGELLLEDLFNISYDYIRIQYNSELKTPNISIDDLDPSEVLDCKKHIIEIKSGNFRGRKFRLDIGYLPNFSLVRRDNIYKIDKSKPRSIVDSFSLFAELEYYQDFKRFVRSIDISDFANMINSNVDIEELKRVIEPSFVD